jgi:hypothetical protein
MIVTVARGRISGEMLEDGIRIVSFDRFHLMEPGDLIVLGAYGVLTPLVDTRFTWLTTHQAHSIPGSPARHVWTGYWQAPADVPVNTEPLYTNILDFHPLTYIGIDYAIYRNVTAIGAPTEGGLVFPRGIPPEFQEVSVPEEPARAAIALFFEESYGTVPGRTFSTPDWTPEAQGNGRASCSIFLWQSESGDLESIPGYGFRTFGSGGAIMGGHVFAVDYEPILPEPDPTWVVRQWPRDDAYGVSSAPRLWPPPKRNRLAGGYPGGA